MVDHRFYRGPMKRITTSVSLAIFTLSYLGWQPAVSAAQFFEFDFEVSGYRDVTERRFNGLGPTPDVGDITDASLSIQILGTDNNRDGLLEPRQYTAVWNDDFGTVKHSRDDLLLRGISTLEFNRRSLQLNSLDLESHPLDNDPNEVIALNGSSSADNPFSSFLETSAPGSGVARSCRTSDACDVTYTAKEVPEHLSPFASILVLGLGIWMRKRISYSRTTSGR